MTDWQTLPKVFINGQFYGDTDILGPMAENGELQGLLERSLRRQERPTDDPAPLTAARVAYWLFKSEPDAYGIDRLEREGRTEWTRRAQLLRRATTWLRCTSAIWDFSTIPAPSRPGIVGICEVVREAYPDFTQFDPTSEYYDPTLAIPSARSGRWSTSASSRSFRASSRSTSCGRSPNSRA